MASTDMFQFFVVVRNPNLELDLQRIPITNNLQRLLSEQFLDQAQEFIGPNVERHPFCPTYRPSKDEVVTISPFALPSFLEGAIKNPQGYSNLQMPFTQNGPIVKAVVGVDDGHRSGTKRMFFQHFDNRHILRPKRTFLFQDGMFHEVTDPGVTLSDHLTAVIIGQDLSFRSFQRTGQFLDLTGYFKDASDPEIKSILEHPTFCPCDADEIVNSCRPMMRKKFSAILYSKVLDHPKVTPDRIQRGAKRFGINLSLKGPSGQRKLVFPDNTKDAARLLQYLSEELYISDLTEQAYESNSHRPLTISVLASS